MPVVKDPRQAAIDAVYQEYGRAVRAAKFAYDEAIRVALNKRNDDLVTAQRGLPLPQEKEAG